MSCNVRLFCLLLCFTLTLCNTKTDREAVYNEFVNEVINFNAIKETIKTSISDPDVALRMIDASTKIPSGILNGNFYDLGNFDECYSIQYEDIYGKYCLGTLSPDFVTQKYFDVLKLNDTQRRSTFGIHPQPRTVGGSGISVQFQWAVCVPSNWSAADIPGLLRCSEEFCYSKATEPELSSGAIATITLLAVFLAMIILSTALDIFLYYTNKEPVHELLIAFSCWTNGRKIFKSTTNPDQLLCLNGIRAISMMWVILGHEYYNVLIAPLSNTLAVGEWQRDAANMWVNGASVSVDTFLVAGGVVTVYTFLKSMDKGVKFNILLYYVHRYLRLTPALAIMCLIHLYLLNYFGTGPIWKVVDTTLVQTCEKAWWSTLLYISNYVQQGNCLPQSWYLSVDMQLYILSPIVLIPLWKWPKLGLATLASLSVAGCIVPFAIGYTYYLDGDFINLYYSQTYTRFGPYVIGMILGYFLYKIKKSELRIKLPALATCALWLVCLTGLVSCVYAGYPLNVATEEDRWGNSMFMAFNRPAWAVAVSGVIFLCVAGYGGPIDKFLSLPIFQFLTKLSYSMYLIHYAVITIRYALMHNLHRFSDLSNMYAFWGDFMFTLFLSLILCLSFESPIIILEKYLFGRGSAKRAEQQKKQEV